MLQVAGQFRNLPGGLVIPEGSLNVLTGPNNSGKSAILQWLNSQSPISSIADYVSPRRFDVSNQIAISINADEELRSLFAQRKQFNPQNAEFNAPDAVRELLGLEDEDRERVIAWHNESFGRLEVARASATNEFSAPRITIDGRLVSEQGSGSRAVLAVLVALINPRYEAVLIDEPEIGIEPQVQRRLARLIRQVSNGSNGVRAKQVYVATHSHLFLDRDQVTNNHVVTKDVAGFAQIQQVTSTDGLAALVYNLLGNSPGDLFFPDNVLIVEGPSDQIFLKRVIELMGGSGVAIHFADGESKVSAALPAVDQMLKTQAYLPRWYRERICVLVDASTPSRRVEEWRRFLGDDGRRVKRLARNGIEYYYPISAVAQATSLVPGDVPAAISAFIRATSRNQVAGLGQFLGSKRSLALAVSNVMDVAMLSELSPEIRDTVDVLKALSFASNQQATMSALEKQTK